jgi:hypothetical protein
MANTTQQMTDWSRPALLTNHHLHPRCWQGCCLPQGTGHTVQDTEKVAANTCREEGNVPLPEEETSQTAHTKLGHDHGLKQRPGRAPQLYLLAKQQERTAVPKTSPSGLNCTKTSRTTTQHPVRVVSPRSQASEQPEGRPLVRQRQQITLAPLWVGQPRATERTSDSPKRQRLDCHLPYLIYIRGPHAVIASCVGDNTRAR